MMRYLTALFLCLAILQGKAQYKVLLNFNGTNGSTPRGSLIVAGNKLYGMTDSGGANSYGCIFSIDTDGNGYKDMLDFNLKNGAYPHGSLLYYNNMLYGMASLGGAYNMGCVFSIAMDGSSYTDLHDFGGSPNDGSTPKGALINVGNRLYGTTRSGSYMSNSPTGVSFGINPDGSRYKIIANEGGSAYGSLTAVGGKLFLLAYLGIWTFDTSGNNPQNPRGLFFFQSMYPYNTGAFPTGSLTLFDNVLYGMTPDGGGGPGVGAIFSIDTNGYYYRVIYRFNAKDGEFPLGSLIFSWKVMYGMTMEDMTYNGGNIFSLNLSDSVYTNLHEFGSVQGEGDMPFGDVTLSGNTLYGMTSVSGIYNKGVVFSYKSIGLGVDNMSSTGSAIKVYPNPSNGVFTLQSSVVSRQLIVEVYNILGEKVYSDSYQPIANGYQLSLSSQPNGIYLYRIISENGNLVGEGKLVIQR
jgi:uncharacterized repeat protein (TIGR03803 family)